jgi:hypothetical protein
MKKREKSFKQNERNSNWKKRGFPFFPPSISLIEKKGDWIDRNQRRNAGLLE